MRTARKTITAPNGTITDYLVAHKARDLDVAVAHYTADAVVTDDGNTYHGRDGIREWLGRAATEYTYVSTLIGVGKVDDHHFDAVHHLEGDFPGGVVTCTSDSPSTMVSSPS